MVKLRTPEEVELILYVLYPLFARIKDNKEIIGKIKEIEYILDKNIEFKDIVKATIHIRDLILDEQLKKVNYKGEIIEVFLIPLMIYTLIKIHKITHLPYNYILDMLFDEISLDILKEHKDQIRDTFALILMESIFEMDTFIFNKFNQKMIFKMDNDKNISISFENFNPFLDKRIISTN